LGSLLVDEDRGRALVMSAGSPWGLMGPPGHVKSLPRLARISILHTPPVCNVYDISPLHLPFGPVSMKIKRCLMVVSDTCISRLPNVASIDLPMQSVLHTISFSITQQTT
jgi:hypothetical protein